MKTYESITRETAGLIRDIAGVGLIALVLCSAILLGGGTYRVVRYFVEPQADATAQVNDGHVMTFSTSKQ